MSEQGCAVTALVREPPPGLGRAAASGGQARLGAGSVWPVSALAKALSCSLCHGPSP